MAGGGGGQFDATSPDLTALMDVLSNLIFFLMASFGAAVIAILPASVPTISEGGENDVAREENQVTATLSVKATGAVSVTLSNNQMLPEDLKPYASTFPPKDGKVNTRAVNDHLWSIKEKFRESKDVVIIPENDVTYEMIVDLMDASRERQMIVGGKSVYPSMFTKVVVSSLVQ
ncbi:MAG: biopolymer transporter ExbD [Deltaproteobacteria bacterium]|nr:biopolymer transporter ExbD [Deltaproteobacteria bacterium]